MMGAPRASWGIAAAEPEGIVPGKGLQARDGPGRRSLDGAQHDTRPGRGDAGQTCFAVQALGLFGVGLAIGLLPGPRSGGDRHH